MNHANISLLKTRDGYKFYVICSHTGAIMSDPFESRQEAKEFADQFNRDLDNDRRNEFLNKQP